MRDRRFRTSLLVRRLSFGSLLKITFLTGAGMVIPICFLFLLVSVISPDSVHLDEGETMLEFNLALLAMMVIGPFFHALFFGIPTWAAFGFKGMFSPTEIEVVRDERDIPPEELLHYSTEVPPAGVPVQSQSSTGKWKWAAFLAVAVVASVVVALFLWAKSGRVTDERRLTIESPDGKLFAVVSTFDNNSNDFRFLVQSIRIMTREEIGDGNLSVDSRTFESGGSAVASIHGCENEDLDVSWTSDTELLIRYSQPKPSWVSFVKYAREVAITLEEVPKAH